jgi:hypothetical protein
MNVPIIDLKMNEPLENFSTIVKFHNHGTDFIKSLNELLNQPENGIELSSCTKIVHTYSFNFIENYKDLKISLNVIISIYKHRHKTKFQEIPSRLDYLQKCYKTWKAITHSTKDYNYDIASYISILSNTDEENKSEIVNYNLLLNEIGLKIKKQKMFSNSIDKKNENLDDLSEDMVESRRFWCNLDPRSNIIFEAIPKLNAMVILQKFIKQFIAIDIIENFKNNLENASFYLEDYINSIKNFNKLVAFESTGNLPVEQVYVRAGVLWVVRYLAYDIFKVLFILLIEKGNLYLSGVRMMCNVYGNILTLEIVNSKKFLKLFKYNIIKKEYGYMLKASTFIKHYKILNKFFDINDLKQIFSNKLPRDLELTYSLP